MRLRRREQRPRRALALGAIAVLLLVPPLTVWFGSVSVGEIPIFGRSGALTIALMALVATVVGVIVSYVPRRSTAWRWGLSLALDCLAALVATLALNAIFSAQNSITTILDILLFGVVGSMVVVATEVLQPGTTPPARSASEEAP